MCDTYKHVVNVFANNTSLHDWTLHTTPDTTTQTLLSYLCEDRSCYVTMALDLISNSTFAMFGHVVECSPINIYLFILCSLIFSFRTIYEIKHFPINPIILVLIVEAQEN